MKKIYILLLLILLPSCTKYQKQIEDYNYLEENSIRFIKNNHTSLLINKDNIYYLLSLEGHKEDIYHDYYINLKDIDKELTRNNIKIKRNDKIEIIIDNYTFCIYIKDLDKDNYKNCNFLYLYNINKDFYITLNNNIEILFYDSYTKFNYKFLYHLSLVWIDTYTIDPSTYLTITLKENNYIIKADKIRGKTIHKKIKT